MRFVNPYNFIPLAAAKPSVEENTEGDYTGYIEYDLYTKTPLFIPNTSNSDTFDVPGKMEKHKSFEFFSYDDLSEKTLKMDSEGPENPVIPGSEIRGMFRSNYEILTNSCLSIVDDDEDIVLAKRTNEVFKPGLIKKEGKDRYSLYEAEDCLLRTYGARDLTDKSPFYKETDWKNSSYVQDLPEGAKVSFERIYREARGKRIKPLAQKVRIYSPEQEKLGLKTGYLIKGESGPEMNSKQEKHCGHVFRSLERRVSGELSLDVLEKALAEYDVKSESYSADSSVIGTIPKYAERSSLPTPLSTYAYDYKAFVSKKDNVGEYFPVYYSKINGSQYLYLSPASITREIYKKKMTTLLGKYAPCNDKSALCPACSLFGTVGKDKDGKMFNSASRVRFTDLHLKKDAKAKYRKVVTLKELSSPKLSNTEFYLKCPAPNAWFWTYDYYVDDKGDTHLWNAEINGRKFYWHRGEADLPGNVEVTERNITVRPLKEGTLFSGKVYFDHITKRELDRLIFLVNTGDAAEPDNENLIQTKRHGYKLGAGKPLGLGSIATSVRSIMIRNISKEADRIDWSTIPYGSYQVSLVDIRDDIKTNFAKLTAFDTVKDGTKIQYPTTGQPGKDGEIYIYDWYSQNHVGYRKNKDNGEYQKNKMPNSRSQMAFNQYMIPMQLELGKTSYADKVMTGGVISENANKGMQGIIKKYIIEKQYGYIAVDGVRPDIMFKLSAFKAEDIEGIKAGAEVRVIEQTTFYDKNMQLKRTAVRCELLK